MAVLGLGTNATPKDISTRLPVPARPVFAAVVGRDEERLALVVLCSGARAAMGNGQ